MSILKNELQNIISNIRAYSTIAHIQQKCAMENDAPIIVPDNELAMILERIAGYSISLCENPSMGAWSWLTLDRLAMERIAHKRTLYGSGHVVLDSNLAVNGIVYHDLKRLTHNLTHIVIDVKRTKNGAYFCEVFGTYREDEGNITINLNAQIVKVFTQYRGNSAIYSLTDSGRLKLMGINPADFVLMLWESMQEINPLRFTFTVEILGHFIGYDCIAWIKAQADKLAKDEERKALKFRISERFNANGLTTSQKRKAKKSALLAKYRQLGDMVMLNHVASLPLSSF